MPNPVATREQLLGAAGVVFALAECIREAREVPSGTLYAVVAGRVNLAAYEIILRTLVRAGLIEVTRAHVIRWIGPEVAS